MASAIFWGWNASSTSQMEGIFMHGMRMKVTTKEHSKLSLLQYAATQMERYGRVKTCLLDFCNSNKRFCYSDCKLAAPCLGLLSGACTTRRRGLGDTGRPDSPLARSKPRNVACQTWKCRPSNRKCRPPKSSPTLWKHIKTRVFAKENALKVSGAAADFGARRNGSVSGADFL